MTLIDKLKVAVLGPKITGTEIEERVRRIYEEALTASDIVFYVKHRAKRIKALQKLSGVPIPEEPVQKAYEQLISHTLPNTEGIRALMETTGYRPKIAPEIVQQGYKKLIDDLPFRGEAIYYNNDRTEQLWTDLEELTGVCVSEEVVQAGYLKYIENSLVDSVGAAYGSVFWSEPGKAFTWLRERTKVPLGAGVKAKLQEIYEELRKPESSYAHMGYIKIMKKTGVPIPEDILQDAYRVLLDKDLEGDSLLDLVQATGVKPSIPADIVQARYLDLLSRWEGGWYSHIKPLTEATSVKPDLPPKKVQEVYRGLLRKGQVDQFYTLIEFTGIEPKKDVYYAFVEHLCGLKKEV